MDTSILFGNGINRAIQSGVSWDDLLQKLMRNKAFKYQELPNTMTYERIFLERIDKKEELELKKEIAKALQETTGNILYEELISLDCTNYLTTNYDYAFEHSISASVTPRASEEIYSLRRYREYASGKEITRLWSLHGEVAHPKSIMLGLDHYCGAIAKLDAYIKGTYVTQRDGKPHSVQKMETKIQTNDYCHTSWVDLFFSTNLHIIGLSLDYSETDLWWILNKRARLTKDAPAKNKIFFHATSESPSKIELLLSFGVEVLHHKIKNNDYLAAYKNALKFIRDSK